jgi:hypothetical protein
MVLESNGYGVREVRLWRIQTHSRSSAPPALHLIESNGYGVKENGYGVRE